MAQSQYSIAWDSFKNNICGGFSALQQSGEFVDMTLAVDGHFVKVHQVIVALASPFLKELMATAPCQHPIIFLNNVSIKVLCYLLEYMYTGEAVVSSEYLASFTEAAKQLHIKGLENVHNQTTLSSHTITVVRPSQDQTGCEQMNVPENTEFTQLSSKKKNILIDIDKTHLPPSARKKYTEPEGAHMSVNRSCDTEDTHDDCIDMLDDSSGAHDDDVFKDKEPSADAGLAACLESIKADPSNLLYSVSIRGALQVILNRYIYNLITKKTSQGVRRWRCVHYQDKKCNAFIITKENLVIKRSNLHNHPFHDKKIIDKIVKKAVFTAIDEVEEYKNKEHAKKYADQDENVTVPAI